MLHSAFILLNSNKACAPPQRFWGSGPQPGRAGVRLQAIGGALAVQQFFYVCQSLFGGLEMDCLLIRNRFSGGTGTRPLEPV